TAAPRPTTPPPAAAPAPAPNRWLGPIAGLAAGLGLAALFSHFGMGGALASGLGSLLMIALVIFGGVLLYRMFRGRSQNAGPANPAFAGVEPPMYREPVVNAPPHLVEAPQAASSAANDAPAQPSWTMPADIDPAALTHTAKVLFLRMQASSDAANLADIREFTTPEMYAEIQLEIGAREGRPNQTEVFRLDAQMLGVEEMNQQRLASVRFNGTIREEAGAQAERFSEVWNLTQGPDGRWLLAGIQQAA
ncbi:MAG: import inner rane translocase subunit Tim44, partial [Betaproteobacteria bacterium]|nr:import inner rane translocase subunit Tim44 [Betaproteobacteria bacterium]